MLSLGEKRRRDGSLDFAADLVALLSQPKIVAWLVNVVVTFNMA